MNRRRITDGELFASIFDESAAAEVPLQFVSQRRDGLTGFRMYIFPALARACGTVTVHQYNPAPTHAVYISISPYSRPSSR